MTEAVNEATARRLGWAGVLFLVIAVILAPQSWGPAVAVSGAGLICLAAALLRTNQRTVLARILFGGGVLTAVYGIFLTITGVMHT